MCLGRGRGFSDSAKAIKIAQQGLVLLLDFIPLAPQLFDKCIELSQTLVLERNHLRPYLALVLLLVSKLMEGKFQFIANLALLHPSGSRQGTKNCSGPPDLIA